MKGELAPPWPSSRLILAVILTLVGAGATITLAIEPGAVLGVCLALGLSLLGLSTGLLAGVRLNVDMLVVPFTVAACLTTLALWSPLGKHHYGALRHVDMGVSIEPAGLWVISCHLAAVGFFWGKTHGIYLAANLAGAFGAALLMPELSLIPQIVAGTVVVAWMSGRRKLAGAIVLSAIGAVALSSLFPYVQQRWVGFIDPGGHALGAGYDYRAVAQAVAESDWWTGHSGSMPAMSSPTDDYWLAAGLWRIGRLGILAWVGLFGLTLWLSKRRLSGGGERSLLMHAILATMAMSLAVHAAYNLGFIPVTATYPPLAGLAGSITASHLFLVGFCLVSGPAREDPRDEMGPK